MTQNEFLKHLRRLHTLVLRNAELENEDIGNDIMIYSDEEIEMIKIIFMLEEYIEKVGEQK